MARLDAPERTPGRPTSERQPERTPDRVPGPHRETPRRPVNPDQDRGGGHRSRGRARGTRTAPVDRRARAAPRPERGQERTKGTGRDHGSRRSTALSREHPLSKEQIRAVAELGTFRACRPDQLRLESRQVDELRKSGLVRDVTYNDTRYVTLTKDACTYARVAKIGQPGLKLYSGPRKLRDMKHDSAIHAAYVKASQEIESRGGRVTSIARDEDLRRDVNRDRYKNPDTDAKEIADRHKIGVDDNGKLQFPDVQITYEMPAEGQEHAPDSDLDVAHVTMTENIEIVTDNYKHSDIAAKSAAGFTLVSANGGLRANAGDVARAGGIPVQGLADDLINF